jgi:hypothetical protein
MDWVEVAMRAVPKRCRAFDGLEHAAGEPRHPNRAAGSAGRRARRARARRADGRGAPPAGRDAECSSADRRPGLLDYRLAARFLGAGQCRNHPSGRRCRLHVPFAERILCAGEAMADGWRGTVAGAYRSSRDAARAILGEGPCRYPVTM